MTGNVTVNTARPPSRFAAETVPPCNSTRCRTIASPNPNPPCIYVRRRWESIRNKEKSAAVFAVRRANYTHRRKGVFNAGIIARLKGVFPANKGCFAGFFWTLGDGITPSDSTSFSPNRRSYPSSKTFGFPEENAKFLFGIVQTIRGRKTRVIAKQQAGWPGAVVSFPTDLENAQRPGLLVEFSRYIFTGHYPVEFPS